MHNDDDPDGRVTGTVHRSLLTRGIVAGAIAVLVGLASAACSSEATKRAAYEALYQKDCIDRTGIPQCDPEHKDYDQYRQERDETLNPDSSAKSD
jgi:hypothetical protein